jgi:TonB family protein
MRSFHKLFVLLFSIGAFTLSVSAQNGAPAKPPEARVISGGVLNGKATSLPKPEYPADAARDKVAGQVKVQILIAENGTIETAYATGGVEHPSLRQAAVNAAYLATFSPTKLQGKPVKVSGVITYNFVARTNEEKLKLMALTMMLTTFKHFVNSDVDMMKEVFEGEDIFADGAVEFPEFKKELSALASFDKLTPEKRREGIDYALTSIEVNTTGSDKWQIKVGREFGEMFGQLMLLMSQQKEPNIELLKRIDLNTRLNNIRDLTLSAPPDFPADVLARLKELAELGKSNFNTLEDYDPFIEKFDALMNAISPDKGP